MTVSVITGSSTGIGAATALRLARDGHSVVATMRNPDGSDLAARAATEGVELDIRPLDVADEDSVETLFKGVYNDHGRVDVLVNNAGLGTGGLVEETNLDVYARVMETNFFGVLRCTKAVLPSMREQGSGCVVAVSSQAGRIAAPNMSPYTSSKFALEAAMEGLAAEVGRLGIRVAIIEPGMILTPIWGKVELKAPPEAYAHIVGRLTSMVMREMQSGSTAEEVADCIAEAIVAEPPKLRWLVGQGAERNVRNRASWTDEEAIAIWNQPDDDGFMKDIFAGDD
jgi:NAD(P)-dependent dehydrogenase (short-subunit alcohol dehydrogenase family)